MKNITSKLFSSSLAFESINSGKKMNQKSTSRTLHLEYWPSFFILPLESLQFEWIDIPVKTINLFNLIKKQGAGIDAQAEDAFERYFLS